MDLQDSEITTLQELTFCFLESHCGFAPEGPASNPPVFAFFLQSPDA
jgi:hypothetical protein